MPDAVADLRHRLQLVKKACQQIGQTPPRPPGLRSAISGIAVAVMQRLMFWYAPAVQNAIGDLASIVDDALCTIVQIGQQERLLLERQWQEERSLLERQLLEARSKIAILEALLNEQVRALELERATTIEIQGDLREQADALQQAEETRRQKEEEMERRLRESGERLQLVRRETIDNAQRLVRLLDSAAPAERLAALVHENGADLDAIEAALESEIRGTYGEAQERLKAYLPRMPREGPALDIGCGRGEWLELLRREGIPARGVEQNRLMAAECRERSLDAEHADPLGFLARTADGSAGAVTVLRLVERLPLHKLARLIDEAARVLRPGGTAIFATPNPDNLLVSGRDFYKDPTRRHPIPSEILRGIVEARGFEPVEVLFLNPAGEDERVPEEDGAVTRRFNRLFYGPRDYAVVCRKPR
jgi:SAM-dependent methyltransferase